MWPADALSLEVAHPFDSNATVALDRSLWGLRTLFVKKNLLEQGRY